MRSRDEGLALPIPRNDPRQREVFEFRIRSVDEVRERGEVVEEPGFVRPLFRVREAEDAQV